MKLIEKKLSELSWNTVMTGNLPVFNSVGKQLQYDLGLSKFKNNVWIQKVLNIPISIFIITFNSRYPNVDWGTSRVRKIKSTQIKKIKQLGLNTIEDRLRMTPPLKLSSTHIRPRTGSLLILRDIAGEYLRNPKAFEIQ